ncbi:ABC-2 type transport system permease protein [Aequitasia blattaphilus]|uniref:ABC transporter permease n=1 Tax=Aequitasia blattaphilus TaxID=2949332 RepID=A0ABT1EBI3_9FIRM|nr:ABC transporter permease [Aequitasia blattaphilus]MCP1103199.1 ABC transporter permease [Aequitasia blattaphilus]MCR8615839.1 ABC transporter permease [Aequitasia blattaphilus]
MNFLKIVKYDFINILHNPALIISNTILPVVLIAVLGFVTQNNFGKEPLSAYDYQSVNMLIFSVSLIVAITTSNSFMEEKVIRGNMRIAYAPVSKMEMVLSKIVSSYIFVSICYGMLIPFCQYILGVNMGGNRCLWFALLLNAFSFFECCFGAMFCCIFRSEEQANSIMQIPLFIFIFLGGVLVSIHRLGKIVNEISYISPVKWIVRCSYQIIYDNDLHLLLSIIISLAILSLICLLICGLRFKPEEYI